MFLASVMVLRSGAGGTALLLVPDLACLELTQLSWHYSALPSWAFTQNKAELLILSLLFIVSRCPSAAMAVNRGVWG